MMSRFDRMEEAEDLDDDGPLRSSSRSRRSRRSKGPPPGTCVAILIMLVAMLGILVVYALVNDVNHFASIRTMMKMFNNASSMLCCEQINNTKL